MTKNTISKYEQTIAPQARSLNPLYESFSMSINKKPSIPFKPFKLYKACIGRLGDLAEKIATFLHKIPLPRPINALGVLDVAVDRIPKLVELVNKENRIEREIICKQDSLVKSLLELDISVPAILHTSRLELTVEQLECVYETVNDCLMEPLEFDPRLVVEAKTLILDLQNLLQDYKVDNEEEAKKLAKSRLRNNPLLSKVAPLTLSSAGGALGAFVIDQQGVLPYDWNPNNYVSNMIINKASSMLTYISSIGDLCIDQGKAAILGNVTIVAGTYALSSFNDNVEESKNDYLEYFSSSLVNQIFVCSFAYLGTRFCGSKERIKGFVESRISSTIAYKACEATLDYLGASFWSNKAISLLAGGVVNPVLDLVDC